MRWFTVLIPSLLPLAWAETHCKPLASSAEWPQHAEWTALNQSVSGNLVVPVPPAAVCHPTWPQFNPEECAIVQSNWSSTLYHASNLVSVDYNDDTCYPNATLPCSAKGYPRYVIEAKSASDVQAGVRFAARTGVRLIIKGTGHDYPGRSSGPDSLSINTHHIRGLTYHKGDPAAVALGGVGSVKIHAGEQMRAVYAFAIANNITIVTGSDPDVGIGGWVSGAGHSPVSSRYGLGADQVIEMEVVTADGQLRTINATCEPDLFWALRGGGASTFGVLISVTVRVHPLLSGSDLTFSYYTTPNSDTYWSMAAFFASQLPHFSEAGLMGYFYMYPSYNVPNTTTTVGLVYGLFLAPELSRAQTADIIAPFEKKLRSQSWADAVHGNSTPNDFANFESYWHGRTPAELGGGDGRLGSRLLGNSSLLGDFDQLRDALRNSSAPNYALLGNLVAGPGVRSPPGGIAGGSNAVLPAWREAYSHTILVRSWSTENWVEKALLTTELRDVNTEALRRISPGGGAYVNEADPTEPNWQQTFWGANYDRLLEIKKTWDPTGVFWCKNCVGSELWTLIGPYGVENGVGQNFVQLCRGKTT